MALAFLLDQHVKKAVALGLRRRGVDAVTAFEDGSSELADPDLLGRAAELGRVLVTRDEDFLVLAAQRRAAGTLFAGIVYVHQDRLSVGRLVTELELLAKVGEPGDLRGQALYLPL